MAYTQALESPRPGCLIILVDQSVTMQACRADGSPLCDVVATFVNGLLAELIRANVHGASIKPRLDVAVLGYSGSDVRPSLPSPLDSQTFVSLKALMDNPLRIEDRIKEEMDDQGAIIEIPVLIPIWVEARAQGEAPIYTALRRAKQLAEQWCASHPANFPPLILNVTSGSVSDGDLAEGALALSQVRTEDGAALFFNCYLTLEPDLALFFSGGLDELPPDPVARQLFALSSVIPESMRKNYWLNNGQNLPAASRGFCLNTAAPIRQLLTFGTLAVRDGAPFQEKAPRPSRPWKFRFTTRQAFDEAMIMGAARGRLRLADPDIRSGHVVVTKLQTRRGILELPWATEGGFAVVYKYRTGSNELRAVRCFRRLMPTDVEYRFNRVNAYFQEHCSDFTIPIEYHPAAIAVETIEGDLDVYPLMTMEWIEGKSLLETVDDLCRRRDHVGLGQLAESWVGLIEAMQKAQVAHGDLTGDNVMVTPKGKLVLIDYDGAYVPDLEGMPPIVLGHPDYQHPAMVQRPFDQWMDTFSALVIYTGLLALSERPMLWDAYSMHDESGNLLGERLLFQTSDFEAPGHSRLFQELETLTGSTVRIMVHELRNACLLPIQKVHWPSLYFDPSLLGQPRGWSNLEEAFQNDDDKQVVAAWSPAFDDYLPATVYRSRVELARRRLTALERFREALTTDDDETIVANYDPILDTSPLVQAEQRRRLDQARRHVTAQVYLHAFVMSQPYVDQWFDLAVIVRHPSSPIPDKQAVLRLKPGYTDLSEAEPYALVRLYLRAPECDLKESSQIEFRMYSARDSLVYYFQLRPKRPGLMSFVVELYQGEEWRTSAREETIVRSGSRRSGRDTRPLPAASQVAVLQGLPSASSMNELDYRQRANLRALLMRHFSEEEMRDITFDLGFDHETVGKDKPTLARELIALVERNNRIRDLLDLCHTLRPNAPWRSL